MLPVTEAYDMHRKINKPPPKKKKGKEEDDDDENDVIGRNKIGKKFLLGKREIIVKF